MVSRRISVIIVLVGLLYMADCRCSFGLERFRPRRIWRDIPRFDRFFQDPFFQSVRPKISHGVGNFRRFFNDVDFFPRRRKIFSTFDPFKIFELKNRNEQNRRKEDEIKPIKEEPTVIPKEVLVVEEQSDFDNPNEITVIEEDDEEEDYDFDDYSDSDIVDSFEQSIFPNDVKSSKRILETRKNENYIEKRYVNGEEIILKVEKKFERIDGREVFVEKTKRSIGSSSMEIERRDGDIVMMKYWNIDDIEVFDEKWEEIGVKGENRKLFLSQNETR